MRKLTISCLITLLVFSRPSRAQQADSSSAKNDVISFGLGIGLDHGGFGANLIFYPQKNIGLFAGGGVALAGFGFNGGIKLRLLPKGGSSAVHPYVEAMYGYNAAIYISDGPQYNKLFYGPTLGIGIDTHSKKPGTRGYWSFALLIPIRSPDVQNYINSLQNDGVSFSNNLIPIGFSIGYKFILL
jgi:hypothetical protein